MRRIVTSLACCLVLLCSVTAMAASSTVVISQFRTRLAASATDEFVELYNLGSTPVNITGWKLRYSASSGSMADRVTIGTVVLAPQSFYLMTIAGGTYLGGTTADATWTSGNGFADACGIGLLNATGTLIDAVSTVLTVPYTGYREGTGLAAMTSGGTTKAYQRKTPAGGCGPSQDTDDNATDFVAVTVTPTIANHSSCKLACATGDSCVWEPICTTTPTATSTSYAGSAACPGGTGPCVYTPTATPCPAGCNATTGLCNVDLCVGVTCDTAPDACHSASGTCTGGICTYPVLLDQACDDDDPCTETDKCIASGACVGTPMTCGPSRPTCIDDATSRTFSNAHCDTGICMEDQADTPCAFGCDAASGTCIPDPCEGIVCDAPPNTQCYPVAGTCVLGFCDYAPNTGSGCDDADLCSVDDTCSAVGDCMGTPVVCDPVAPECRLDVLVTFSNGQCDGGTGNCTFTETPENCTYGCNAIAGACNPDPCLGVTCATPPNGCYATAGSCSLGDCTYFPDDALPCSDGVACTTGDHCVSGACTSEPVVCDPKVPVCSDPDTSRTFADGACGTDGACAWAPTDTPCAYGCVVATGLCNGDPCAGVVCDTPPDACHLAAGSCSGGTCTYGFKPRGAGCDDLVSCTLTDECDGAGACAGTPLACNTPPNAQCWDAAGICTAGTCDYTTKALATPCTDANPCTLDDACNAGGTCVGTQKTCDALPPACVDGKSRAYSAGACRIDNGQCDYATDDTACTFGCNDATGNCKADPCLNVTCVTPPNGQCYAATGTCSDGLCTYAPVVPGTSCDDGIACTIDDACDAAHACVGTQMPCATPPNTQCWAAAGACTNGVCDYPAKETGTGCDDGDACSEGDACTAAHACAGTPKVCATPPNLTCWDAVGTCLAGVCGYTAKDAATVCDDGNMCTTGDACGTAHACAGTAKVCVPPAPTCADGVSHISRNGVCAVADGSCAFEVVNVTCTAGCGANGLCKQSVLIAEFRTRNGTSATDEYVELYNPGDTSVNLGGWKLVYTSATGTTLGDRVVFPANTVMQPKSFLLNTYAPTTGTGYLGTVTKDFGYTTGIADGGGIGIVDATGAVVDAVGMTSTTGLKEGTTLPLMTTAMGSVAYLRKTAVCGPDQDTGDNLADFTLVNTPDPKNSKSCRPTCVTDRCPAYAACGDANTSNALSGGTCDAAPAPEHCTFAVTTPTACAFGCSAGTGLCNPDPCDGVVCTQTTDTCRKTDGTCSNGVCAYAPKDAGDTCTDADACTVSDACDGTGVCIGVAMVCATPPNAQCWAAAGACVAGACQYTPIAETTVCDDGNLCTEGDACDAGHACTGILRSCPPVDPTCEPGDVTRRVVPKPLKTLTT
jgi:hypothetical protein